LFACLVIFKRHPFGERRKGLSNGSVIAVVIFRSKSKAWKLALGPFFEQFMTEGTVLGKSIVFAGNLFEILLIKGHWAVIVERLLGEAPLEIGGNITDNRSLLNGWKKQFWP
jgi:hypothetical protein